MGRWNYFINTNTNTWVGYEKWNGSDPSPLNREPNNAGTGKITVNLLVQ